MKILILDDEPERHEGFKKIFAAGNHELFHAYNSEQFKAMFEAHAPFELICFDHDLGQTIDTQDGPMEITGRHCALYVVEAPKELHPKTVLIHSWNDGGVASIRNVFHGTTVEIKIRPYSSPTPKNK